MTKAEIRKQNKAAAAARFESSAEYEQVRKLSKQYEELYRNSERPMTIETKRQIWKLRKEIKELRQEAKSNAGLLR